MSKIYFYRSVSRLAAVAAAFSIATGVHAQTAPETEGADSAAGSNEIIVTAQFREQNLQDTPLAITAVSSEMLEARSQTDLSQVARQAPNVTLSPAGQAFGASMVASIRGVGQSDF